MTVRQKLQNIWVKSGSLLCVGLDSDMTKLPESVRNKKDPQFTFNKAIIDATHAYICAYKPNTAFYEGRGADGIRELKMTCDYLKSTYPEIFLIIDAKRGDIGNTNTGYAAFAFDYLGGDAVTLHPYLGKEALKPFLERDDKGSIILCRTSNPGGGEFQDLQTGGAPLYLTVANRVAREWDTNRNCMLVVGATYPDELAKVRDIAGDMPLLVPGIGVQGGDLAQIMAAGLDSHDTGMIINSSRGIIFAGSGADYPDAAAKAADTLCQQINVYRNVGKEHQ